MYELYCFDVDGTLIESFMDQPENERDYDRVALLPNRKDLCEYILARGKKIALITNQAGVAFGYQTEGQVYQKLDRVCEELGLRGGSGWAVRLYIAFCHPKASVPAYKVQRGDPVRDRRKPSPVMINEARLWAGCRMNETVMVGDMQSDLEAARAAGVPYFHPDAFFPKPPVSADVPIGPRRPGKDQAQ